MAKVKGTVTKAGKGKYSYFLQLDGNDFYYNTKFEPKCGEGDVVGIEFEKKGDSRGQISKCVVLEDNSGGYKASNSERDGGNGGSNRGGSKASSGAYKSSGGGNRNESIVLQHSQEMAIRAAAIILAQEAFAVKGKPDARYIQIEGLIDTLTVKFYKDALDPASSALLKEAKKLEEDSDDWDEDEKSSGDSDDWDDWD